MPHRLCIVLGLLILPAFAFAGDPAPGTLLKSDWQYSRDGGKTFSPQAPLIEPDRVQNPAKSSVSAKCTFTIDDPAKIGLLKLRSTAADGAFSLTNDNSIDRYNVGTKPNLLNMKLLVNDKPVADLDENVLYRYVPIDPNLLKAGANTITVSGVFWFQLSAAMEAGLALETLPLDLAMLDRPVAVGGIGEDYFGLTARSILPAEFTVAVTPTEPAGAEQKTTFPRGRWLKARVPVAKGTKALKYALTVKTPGGSKTYGPYDLKMPNMGVGFKFVAAGNTAVYMGATDRLKTFMAKVLEVRPDVFVHVGKFVEMPAWDWTWNDVLVGVHPDAFARVPTLALCGIDEMASPMMFSRQFYFAPDDKDFGHWTAAYGKVRFVAIETWSESVSKNPAEAVKWLDDVLSQAKEDYVIVLNHQVPHHSTPNAGRAVRPVMAFVEKYIDPILVKHKVTLTMGGHLTGYERAEPPAGTGVMSIMTCMAGGSGKPLQPSYVEQNKCSRATHRGDHYVLFEVKADSLEMKTVDVPTGKVVDTYSFKPRK
ncbi:MAG: hypothetical protein LLG01_12335 [Planctomycetaceae bacterium]|nr:hypothetical protein [Planctomycetaceae bacterium]